MQCSSCGAQLPEGAAHCPTCGTVTPYRVSASGIAPNDPTVASSSPSGGSLQAPPPTDYGSASSGLPQQNPYEQNPYSLLYPEGDSPLRPPPRHKVKIGLLIGAVVLVLALVSGSTVAFLTLSRGSTPTVTLVPSSQVTPQSCRSSFSDEFNGKLNPQWNWINPSGNATYNMATNGFLSITTPPNSDLNPGNNFNAPRLLQPISGDFTVETLVKFSPIAFYQSAGILIWQDQTKFLRFELAYPGRNDLSFHKDDNGLFSQNLGPYHNLPTGPIALRVQRQGDHFTASWHEPNQVWQIDAETDMHFGSPMVGLDLLATSNAPQTTAYYDYFRVSCT